MSDDGGEIVRQEIHIHPTASIEKSSKKSYYHSDIALTGLFSSYISSINSHRQVIWNRFNIMLIANTAILGFVSNINVYNPLSMVFAAIFGISLCVIWHQMNLSVWTLYNRLVDKSASFNWTGLDYKINPMQDHMELRGYAKSGEPKMGSVYYFSVVIIFIFGLAHLLLSWFQIMKCNKTTMAVWEPSWWVGYCGNPV